jgi:hypothetical protein
MRFTALRRQPIFPARRSLNAMNTLEAVVKERAGGRRRLSTEAEMDAQIDREIEASVCYYAKRGSNEISHRLGELDREWSIERVIEMKAATLAFFGVILGLLGRKRWLIVSGIVLPFLFEQAMEGTSAPYRLLRRFGLRTQREIDRERYALKAVRGDFAALEAEARPAEILSAAAA